MTRGSGDRQGSCREGASGLFGERNCLFCHQASVPQLSTGSGLVPQACHSSHPGYWHPPPDRFSDGVFQQDFHPHGPLKSLEFAVPKNSGCYSRSGTPPCHTRHAPSRARARAPAAARCSPPPPRGPQTAPQLGTPPPPVSVCRLLCWEVGVGCVPCFPL